MCPRRLRGIGAVSVLAGLAIGAESEVAVLEPGSYRLHLASVTNGAADPVQDTEACLRAEELADLGAYFMPSLEGTEARCEAKREPGPDPRKIDYRMHCEGDGFTTDAATNVTIESPQRFTLTLRMDSRTATESALVTAEIEGRRVGSCAAGPVAPSSGPDAAP